jgi:hypothetical protein
MDARILKRITSGFNRSAPGCKNERPWELGDGFCSLGVGMKSWVGAATPPYHVDYTFA